MNSDVFPDTYDPLEATDGEEYESDPIEELVMDEDNSEEPVYNDVEECGLKKTCQACGAFMDTISGTAAEVLNDPGKDNIDVRTWAKCAQCGAIRIVA